MTKLLFALALLATLASTAFAQQSTNYRVLATSKTSTMEKEMEEAGALGYHFVSVMGGETAAGGNEVVVLMQKSGDDATKYRYRLLATSKTSSMQRELQDASDEGFEFIGQTVFKSAFGGSEVVAILERGTEASAQVRYDYKLVATSKTSTLQKELQEMGRDGYQALDMAVGKTAMGGNEIVVILRKRK
jgi:opacity protein-like surface antigen